MSDFRAFKMGVNVLTSFKDGKFRAMTCAWAMMADYDKVLMLVGSQSDTGKALKKGDKVGLSALSSHQEFIGNYFGDNHSDSFQKFNQHYLENYNGVYVVKEAKVKMCLEVINIYHLEGIENDNLVYLKVLNESTDDNREFLSFN